MPSERFLKLSEEKRSRIAMAAVEEFSQVSMDDASINKIVKAAGISRGSFYTYFEDKEDLFRYVFRSFREDAVRVVDGMLEDNDYDLIGTVRDLAELALRTRGDRSTVSGRLCNVLMKDFKVLDQVKYLMIDVNRAEGCSPAEQYEDRLYREVSRRLEISREDFHAAADMLCCVAVKSLVICFQYPEQTEGEKAMLERQLEMIGSILDSSRTSER